MIVYLINELFEYAIFIIGLINENNCLLIIVERKMDNQVEINWRYIMEMLWIF